MKKKLVEQTLIKLAEELAKEYGLHPISKAEKIKMLEPSFARITKEQKGWYFNNEWIEYKTKKFNWFHKGKEIELDYIFPNIPRITIRLPKRKVLITLVFDDNETKEIDHISYRHKRKTVYYKHDGNFNFTESQIIGGEEGIELFNKIHDKLFRLLNKDDISKKVDEVFGNPLEDLEKLTIRRKEEK